MATTKTDDVSTHCEAGQLLKESLDTPALNESSRAPAEVPSSIKILSSAIPTNANISDDATADLKAKNIVLLDQVKVLKFVLVITLIMLINIPLFEKFMNSATALVIFAIFEAVLILIAAKRFGIPEVWKIFNTIVSAMAKRP